MLDKPTKDVLLLDAKDYKVADIALLTIFIGHCSKDPARIFTEDSLRVLGQCIVSSLEAVRATAYYCDDLLLSFLKGFKAYIDTLDTL